MGGGGEGEGKLCVGLGETVERGEKGVGGLLQRYLLKVVVRKSGPRKKYFSYSEYEFYEGEVK